MRRTTGARRNKKGRVSPSTEKNFAGIYHTVFNATKQQLVQSDKGNKNISLENKTHHKLSKNTTLIVRDSIASGIEKNNRIHVIFVFLI